MAVMVVAVYQCFYFLTNDEEVMREGREQSTLGGTYKSRLTATHTQAQGRGRDRGVTHVHTGRNEDRRNEIVKREMNWQQKEKDPVGGTGGESKKFGMR